VSYRESIPSEPILEWYCSITNRRRYRIVYEDIIYLFVREYHFEGGYGWIIYYDNGSSKRQPVSFWTSLKLKWKLRKLLDRL